MNFYDHALGGCTSRPLANYLKAVAVLRLVAEQKDPLARGYWQNEMFHLVTCLDEPELCRFFLEEWQPTALVSPWNKASGFFAAKDKGLSPVEQSTAPRFEPLRAGIRQARALTEAMNSAVSVLKDIKNEANRIKDPKSKAALREDPVYKQRLARAERDCKRQKDEMQPECQRRWRGGSLRWLRAAVVIDGSGEAKFPAMLGTGGNDGKLDFTNNAYQRLGDLFDLSGDGSAVPAAAERLRSALWGNAVPGQLKGAIGQYSPAASGGANSTSGALGDSLMNPWDLLLLLEGSILFTTGTTRRLLGKTAPLAAAPFAVRGQAAGYGSASSADEGVRGEQWMPLWQAPWTLSELTSVLSEGRAQLGARPSENVLEMARSVARLGVVRGISSFERYGYLERNGKSNYAVPLGLWRVQPEPRSALLDDLEAGDWWNRVRRSARSKGAPASFVHAERILADSVLGALAHGKESARWTGVLLALSRLEGQMVYSGAFTAKQRLSPIPRLSAGWLDAIDDGSPELRLALCLAGSGAGHWQGRPRESVRSHWLPLDPKAGRFKVSEKALAHDPRVVMHGRDPLGDLVALVQRRLIESETGAHRRLPLQARPGCQATAADLGALLSGCLDLNRIVTLARVLSALDWPTVTRQPVRSNLDLEPAYMALRLTHLPWKEIDGHTIPVDPAPLRLLASGEASRAIEIVLRRLRASGVQAPIRVAALDSSLARLFAASLAFPISQFDAIRYIKVLDPQSFAKEPSHVR
ncbi:type I-U CRISPR-associated protein Csx17 [bacterium]|nr:type I-U CRISPR-associated protein Csx17 [bacterium]